MTIATLLNEYLAPVQPDDCRAVNEARLIDALKGSGPVVHRAEVFTLGPDGKLNREKRPVAKVPATEHEPERDPTDEELAKVWGVKAASDTPAEQPIPASPTQTPEPSPAHE